MGSRTVQDKDLLDLFSAFFNEKVKAKIFKIIFTESNDDEMIDKLIDAMEKVNDQD